ncbi:MAG: Fur family transcriptional regulator [Candidatus Zhuqueibacterota bacterium]
MNYGQLATTTHLRELLVKKGVKPSFQRVYILQYIMNSIAHPSVDEVYNALYNEIPTLSKTTVYNTLKMFAEKGLVSALTISDTEMRYDHAGTRHAHFMCLVCHRIYDIPLESNLLTIEKIDDHEIVQTEISFKGICKSCLNSKSDERSIET